MRVRRCQRLVRTHNVLDFVLLRHQVGMHGVHGDAVVVVGRLGGGRLVLHFLDVVRLKDLVLVEWEGVLNRDVLDVAARDEVFVLNVLLLVV